jgi:hypothetical protein
MHLHELQIQIPVQRVWSWCRNIELFLKIEIAGRYLQASHTVQLLPCHSEDNLVNLPISNRTDNKLDVELGT